MRTLKRHFRGLASYHQGRAAEKLVIEEYVRRGAEILDTRWRGTAGEIDIVLQLNGVVVFVEVKSSQSLAGAAASLSRHQQLRILAAAEEYIGDLDAGLLTDMRVDVALVSGGKTEIIEGAMGP